MPSAQQILDGLTLVANRFLPLAVAWHVLLLALLVAFWAGVRPARRWVAVALSAPLACVSVLAWVTGNPFNGLTFAAMAATLCLIATRLPRQAVTTTAPVWARAAGVAILSYAWLYPHFLASHSPALYLMAAPMGLLPCPTLSMVLGLGLLMRGLESRSFALLVAGAGLFYALFGMLRLGVWLDAGLLLSATAMAVLAHTSLRVPPASSERSSLEAQVR